MPPRPLYVGEPVVAQVLEVPLLPGVKPAPETPEPVSSIAPKSSSLACAVVAVVPLDADEPVPAAKAV